MGVPIPVWLLFFISGFLILVTRKPKLAKSQEDNPEAAAAFQRKLAGRSGFFLPRSLVMIIFALSIVLLLMFAYQGITTHQAPPANPNATEVVVPNGAPLQVEPDRSTPTTQPTEAPVIAPAPIDDSDPIIKPAP